MKVLFLHQSYLGAYLKLSDEGFIVTIVRSKADQEGVGQTIAIPRVANSPILCLVQAALDWMAYRIDHNRRRLPGTAWCL